MNICLARSLSKETEHW